jgi:hypothetical protein
MPNVMPLPDFFSSAAAASLCFGAIWGFGRNITVL